MTQTEGIRVNAKRRTPALDGLRGVAVLMVVVSHISGRIAGDMGPAGVTVFFALSGYLITSLLLSEHDRGRIDLRAFYLRRVRRLFPALLVMLVTAPVLYLLINDPRRRFAFPDALRAVFYLEDFFKASGSDSIFAHTWSLAVEEQFYILWPAALILILRKCHGDRRRLAVIAGAVCGVAAAWHVIAMLTLDRSWVYYSPDSNAVFLLLGCALAAACWSGMTWAPTTVVSWLAIAVMVSSPLAATRIPDRLWIAHNGCLALTALAACALLLAPGNVFALHWSWLRWFGTISYGLYLWHWTLISLQPRGHELSGLQRPMAAALAVLIAAASWYAVERPIVERGKRRRSRHRAAVMNTDPAV